MVQVMVRVNIKLVAVNCQEHRTPPWIVRFWDNVWKLRHSSCDEEMQELIPSLWTGDRKRSWTGRRWHPWHVVLSTVCRPQVCPSWECREWHNGVLHMIFWSHFLIYLQNALTHFSELITVTHYQVYVTFSRLWVHGFKGQHYRQHFPKMHFWFRQTGWQFAVICHVVKVILLRVHLLCRRTKVFALRSEAPINFEFQLAFVQQHAAFTVDPLAGKHMYHLSHLMDSSGCGR